MDNLDRFLKTEKSFFNKKDAFERLELLNFLIKFPSIPSASKNLKITSNYIMKIISDIEDEIGIVLFEKNTKKIILTKEGEKFFFHLNELSQNLSRLQDNISSNIIFERDKFRASVAISIEFSFLIAKKMKYILEKLPEFSFDISILTKKITKESLKYKTFFILDRNFDDFSIELEYLGNYELTFGASKAYIQKNGYPKFKELIAFHDFMCVKDYNYESLLPTMHKYINKKYVMDNEFSAMKAIEYGCGIGIFPKFAKKDFKDIITFEMGEPMNKLDLYIGKYSVKENNLVSLLIETFKEQLNSFKLYPEELN